MAFLKWAYASFIQADVQAEPLCCLWRASLKGVLQVAFIIVIFVFAPLSSEAASIMEQKHRDKADKGSAIELKAAPKSLDIKGLKEDVCFPIDKIKISGIRLVDEGVIRKAVEGYGHNCLGNVLAKVILSAVNEVYASRGFVTTQAYVPSQDIKGARSFHIEIVLGRVEKIVLREYNVDERFQDAFKRTKEAKSVFQFLSGLSGMADALDNRLDRFQLIEGKRYPAFKLGQVMPLEADDVLNLDRIQQGIDQMNRLPYNKANAKLEPGTSPGTSVVVVENKRQDSFRLNMGYELNGADLNGSGATTAKRYRFDIAKDNLFGLQETMAASYAGGLDSNEVRASLSVPYQWLTLSADAGYTENLSALSKATELFIQNYNASGSAAVMLSRDKEQQTSMISSLSWRHSQRYINSLPLTPQVFSIARQGVQHQRFYDTAQLSFGLGVSKGLKLFGAIRDPALRDDTTPRAQFIKIDGSFSYTQLLKGLGALKFDAAGFYANHPLYSDDQLTLGSPAALKGFTRQVMKLDRGFTLRGEYAAALPADQLFGKHKEDFTFLHESVASLQPYIFSEYGYGRELANKYDVARANIGAGLRYKQGRINLDASFAQPVYNIGVPLRSKKDLRHPEFYLTLSGKIF